MLNKSNQNTHNIKDRVFYTFAQLGVIFINLFTRRFYGHRSQNRKKAACPDFFLALLGSVHVKAARKNDCEIDPRSSYQSMD